MAIKHYSRAIRIDPTFIEAYLGLVKLYKGRGNRSKKAERLLRLAYRMNPRHVQTRDHLKDLFETYERQDLIALLEDSSPLPEGLLTESEPPARKSAYATR